MRYSTDNPALWEGDQYLLEMEVDPTSDPKKPRYRYTEKAKKAQRAWQRLMNNRKPRKNLPQRLLASSGNRVPYLLYGWPFKKDHMVHYARRHKLIYPTTKNNRAAFGGIEEFHFDSLTDDDMKDESRMVSYRRIAASLVITRLIEATGFHIELGRPFSFDYDEMLVLWSNHTFEEYVAMPAHLGLFEKGKAIIDAAMNEGNTGKKVELRWWWSWDGNDMSVFESVD
ncbi:hypothetical protein L226DRAFT_224211 [Lentinus tigrinus ALCF2SS1-7]|uniref:uncharacterized protein n=1 Tax=Lentinus tigrinus ALCF2SS1-7 TaxID=1328758 RepID=UPI0011663D2D|nr:hypothetical protein L226DRAFT_224211 [Lentinus tigrinus ALCF2SS1-7]